MARAQKSVAALDANLNVISKALAAATVAAPTTKQVKARKALPVTVKLGKPYGVKADHNKAEWDAIVAALGKADTVATSKLSAPIRPAFVAYCIRRGHLVAA